MKLFKYLLPIALAVGFSSASVFATLDQDGTPYLEELNERDFDALKDYINTKRTIDVAEKGQNLTISGDVRTEWRHLNEKAHGHKVRGGGAINAEGLPISRNDFDIIFNLWFDYVCDRGWAVAQLEFDNSAGVDDCGLPCRVDPNGYHGSGFGDDLNLKKAYVGYNICCEGCTRFDVELGRRNLYNVFDSKIQYLSRFDGVLFNYQSCWECVADWYVKLGGWVVDERVNHFAWATEIGFLNICDWGVDFKYSFTDWRKNGKNRCFVTKPKGFKHLISQFTLAYNFDPDILCMPAKLYGAFLWNHDAHHFDGQKDGLGWYVGFTVGEVVCEGDWAIDLQYQVVQAAAIPDGDVSGIGRGNTLNGSVTSNRNGNTNYKGWRLEGLYAVTDNWVFDAIVEFSRADNKKIGGSHHFSMFELQAIYAF